MAVVDCRYFTGYKPCGRSQICDSSCSQQEIPRTRLLLIHLGAMGAVVRTTSLLAAIKRQHPSSHLTWVTAAPMDKLLKTHRRIDRVLTTSTEDQLVLSCLEFDVAYVIDKSLTAMGLLKLTKAEVIRGFTHDARTGSIMPATAAAIELWNLGLDDHQKFFVNQKTEAHLQHEALELGLYRRDDYDLPLMPAEKAEVKARHQRWSLAAEQPVIGLNTGCGPLMPAKKWTVAFHREVISHLLSRGFRNIVLLGGPEDDLRNHEIARDLPVLLSPTKQGIRDGFQSVAACDIVITGDSLGMHLAIASRQFVVAWFGPSCAQEIDLFDRGVSLRASVSCGPCWKKSCSQVDMCFDQISLLQVDSAVAQGVTWWETRGRGLISSQPNPQMPEAVIE